MSEYTPTTEQMREDHELFTTYTVHHFDRWLATVKAKAWDEGYTSGHSRAMRRMSDEPNVPPAINPYKEDEVISDAI